MEPDYIRISKSLAFLLLITPFTFAFAAAAPEAGPEVKENPQVSAVLSEISATQIEATIRKLVGFGTRHTLSDTQSETRGIGAARQWIKSEFERGQIAEMPPSIWRP